MARVPRGTLAVVRTTANTGLFQSIIAISQHVYGLKKASIDRGDRLDLQFLPYFQGTLPLCRFCSITMYYTPYLDICQVYYIIFKSYSKKQGFPLFKRFLLNFLTKNYIFSSSCRILSSWSLSKLAFIDRWSSPICRSNTCNSCSQTLTSSR